MKLPIGRALIVFACLLAAPAASLASTVTPLPGAPPLGAVSCSSTSFCAAVDHDGRAYDSNGSTLWSQPDQLTYAPPAGTPAQAEFRLDGVSCTSRKFCMAVGAASSLFGDAGAYRWDGAGWTDTGGESGFVPLDGVSCRSPSFCMAVDVSGQAFTWNGTSWSSGTQVTPVPSDAQLAPPLIGVSCASTKHCLAIDDVGHAYKWSEGSWSTAMQVAHRPLSAVSCVSSGACLVTDDGGSTHVWTGSGRTWSAPQLVAPLSVLTSASCIRFTARASSTETDVHCGLIDATGRLYAEDLTFSSGQLTGNAVSVPHQLTSDRTPLSGISCVGRGTCVAVDQLGAAHNAAIPAQTGARPMQPSPPPDSISSYGTPVSYSVSGPVVGLASGNLGTGHGSIIAAVKNTDAVAVLLGHGDGTYSPPVYYPLPSGQSPGAVAVGDFNKDRRADVAVVLFDQSSSAFSVAVLDGRPGGKLGPATVYPISFISQNASQPGLSTAVLSPGAAPSLVFNEPQTNLEAVLVNQGDGTFKLVLVNSHDHNQTPIGDLDVPSASVIDQFAGAGTLALARPNTIFGIQLSTLDPASFATPTPDGPPIALPLDTRSSQPYDAPAADIDDTLSVPIPTGSAPVTLVTSSYTGMPPLQRWWAGPNGATAAVQDLTGQTDVERQAIDGRFGKRLRPGVVLGGLSSVQIFPSDGRELFPSAEALPVDGLSTTWQFATVTDRRRPSDIVVGYLGGEIDVFTATSAS